VTPLAVDRTATDDPRLWPKYRTEMMNVEEIENAVANLTT
jgi:hypothetical protein